MELSVMVFSGYLLSELIESKFKGSTQLLKYSDVLVDGEFDITQIEEERNWVGSRNQRFIYLTSRYSNEIETRTLEVTNEWRINSDGYIVVNGLPSKIC
jgi:anaerobic ribonucleoside-triphosphate reductase activating protein